MKKVIIFILFFTMIILCGCAPRVNEDIKMGLVKLHRASSMISKHNIAHCEDRMREYKKAFDESQNDQDKAYYKSKLELEIEYINANGKLPKKIEKLKKWAFQEKIND